MCDLFIINLNLYVGLIRLDSDWHDFSILLIVSYVCMCVPQLLGTFEALSSLSINESSSNSDIKHNVYIACKEELEEIYLFNIFWLSVNKQLFLPSDYIKWYKVKMNNMINYHACLCFNTWAKWTSATGLEKAFFLVKLTRNSVCACVCVWIHSKVCASVFAWLTCLKYI